MPVCCFEGSSWGHRPLPPRFPFTSPGWSTAPTLTCVQTHSCPMRDSASKLFPENTDVHFGEEDVPSHHPCNYGIGAWKGPDCVYLSPGSYLHIALVPVFKAFWFQSCTRRSRGCPEEKAFKMARDLGNAEDLYMQLALGLLVL